MRALPFFLLIAFAAFAPLQALAFSQDDARNYADKVGQEVLATVTSSALTEAQKQAQLQAMFAREVDIPWIGRFVLGRFWKQANEAQQAQYLEAYGKFLIAHYTSHFADYSGGGYTINSVQQDGESQFTVGMRIHTAEGRQIETSYRLHADRQGQLKVFDIIIEGVSLITTQRSEFGSVVQSQGMDALIRQLQQRT